VNLSNAITLFRIALLWPMAYCLETDHNILAGVILTLAGISDGLDGWIARKLNQITDFGKLMDPVADKLVLCISLIFLVANPNYALSPWLASLLLAREFLITGIRALIAAQGFIMGAQMLGKIKTLSQFFGIGSLFLAPLFNWPSLMTLGSVFLWLSTILSYVSLYLYSKKAYFLLYSEGTAKVGN
jgi:CDP-diacylglycerol--glycerol-3-phosphate 3-phosphatidyltransferase